MRTGRRNQQAMFLENLWKEMDKLSSSRDGSISRTAAKYMQEGYDNGEIVELLVADGFDHSDARHCVAKTTLAEGCEEAGESSLPEWGFEAEDQQRGDVVSNFDVGCQMVKAAKEDVAMEKAQSFLDENCTGQYSVIKVHKL